jgi:hypothetical protein
VRGTGDRNSGLLPEHGPVFGLGKGETGAVPGHGPARNGSHGPTYKSGISRIVPYGDGPLKDPAR